MRFEKAILVIRPVFVKGNANNRSSAQSTFEEQLSWIFKTLRVCLWILQISVISLTSVHHWGLPCMLMYNIFMSWIFIRISFNQFLFYTVAATHLTLRSMLISSRKWNTNTVHATGQTGPLTSLWLTSPWKLDGLYIVVPNLCTLDIVNDIVF